MDVRDVDDADRRYLERIAEDCERLLGPGISLEDLSVTRGSATTLRVRYALGDVEATSEGRGETVVAAHADLRANLVVDRLRIGARVLVERRTSLRA